MVWEQTRSTERSRPVGSHLGRAKQLKAQGAGAGRAVHTGRDSASRGGRTWGLTECLGVGKQEARQKKKAELLLLEI